MEISSFLYMVKHNVSSTTLSSSAFYRHLTDVECDNFIRFARCSAYFLLISIQLSFSYGSSCQLNFSIRWRFYFLGLPSYFGIRHWAPMTVCATDKHIWCTAKGQSQETQYDLVKPFV